jgi:hypothetical protein
VGGGRGVPGSLVLDVWCAVAIGGWGKELLEKGHYLHCIKF